MSIQIKTGRVSVNRNRSRTSTSCPGGRKLKFWQSSPGAAGWFVWLAFFVWSGTGYWAGYLSATVDHGVAEVNQRPDELDEHHAAASRQVDQARQQFGDAVDILKGVNR